MNPFVEAWRTVVPTRSDPSGLLPPLLVLLTIVTGIIDAYSYLELGRVFVANMTGNVVFLAFALGGAPGFVWWASLVAGAAFVVGAFGGGAIRRKTHGHRSRQLGIATAVQTVVVAAAFLVSLFAPPGTPVGLPLLIVLLGFAMGLQNATARSLGVPDLTTTVLTLTITGLASDSTMLGGSGSRIGRRAVSIAAMFLGAVAGVLFIMHEAGGFALLLAVVLLLVVAGAALTSGRKEPL